MKNHCVSSRAVMGIESGISRIVTASLVLVSFFEKCEGGCYYEYNGYTYERICRGSEYPPGSLRSAYDDLDFKRSSLEHRFHGLDYKRSSLEHRFHGPYLSIFGIAYGTVIGFGILVGLIVGVFCHLRRRTRPGYGSYAIVESHPNLITENVYNTVAPTIEQPSINIQSTSSGIPLVPTSGGSVTKAEDTQSERDKP
ncbi:uncharacterized protein LOC125656257 isoform X2 [Ostrea edulis]|uniref:uncharacterized protein LOC125656257 isoform X2 n=1 Tax=Ostrea edulis TaxID=37623 RepID=UPI0024AE8B83|nr:uncharacterized protein LOC125656257 isoform X2 [Ostrea edulis]